MISFCTLLFSHGGAFPRTFVKLIWESSRLKIISQQHSPALFQQAYHSAKAYYRALEMELLFDHFAKKLRTWKIKTRHQFNINQYMAIQRSGYHGTGQNLSKCGLLAN